MHKYIVIILAILVTSIKPNAQFNSIKFISEPDSILKGATFRNFDLNYLDTLEGTILSITEKEDCIIDIHETVIAPLSTYDIAFLDIYDSLDRLETTIIFCLIVMTLCIVILVIYSIMIMRNTK